MTDLASLAALVPDARLHPATAGGTPIGGLAYDSRRVQPADLFFCIRGARSDGRQFLTAAAAAGAAAAVVDAEVPGTTLPVIHVDSVRKAMPLIAAGFHDYPSRRLRLVGVTGTNGKTTTTYLIRAIARHAGRGSGVIGTVGIWIDDLELPAEHTTPEAPDLQEALARMAATASGREVVVAMEASSHALAQDRTWGCEFDVGVFTNLTQDHLDYHASMEGYFAAKAALFTRYPAASTKEFTAVINLDDPYGERLAELSEGEVIGYGVHSALLSGTASLQAREIEAAATRLRYVVRCDGTEYEVSLPVGGRFNVYNSLAAIGAARGLGFGWSQILPALAGVSGVPGRFESVDEGQPFSVIVDYAHTPDGLENVLQSARALAPRRLIAVFGCGGDRDRTKRPKMGAIAARLADRVIVTSDNPRSEDPAAILREVEAGCASSPAAAVETIQDRREAIQRAITLAEPGDTVVIAGKGHETYQIFRDETIHFDDREEARKALHERRSA